jgi:hypothetical protein
MSIYAENTNVSSEKSRMEIERIIRKYGASGFSYKWIDHPIKSMVTIEFYMEKRCVRFSLLMPSMDEFKNTETGRIRKPNQVIQEYEKAVRQRWRALALVVKAKLEAVQSGITTFEYEFMAHIVLPDGMTVGDHVVPAIQLAYDSGKTEQNLIPIFS